MPNRFEGRISRYLPTVSRGYIKGNWGEEFPFSARDVSNYDRKKIREGLGVQFEIERTHNGRRARDVMIRIPAKEIYLYVPSPDESDLDDEPRTPRYEIDQPTQETTQQREASVEMIALALFGQEIRLVSLTEDGTYKFLDERDRLHNLLYVVSLEGSLLEMAVEELEFLMNSRNAREDDFQNFFERNPDFILNDEYRRAHPQLVLSRDDGQTLRPDFLLEPLDQSSLCDLLELKLPSAQVFVLKRSRARFSAAVFEAAAQLREYSRFFDEEKNRGRFQSAYPGLMVYKPRMVVIIGRRSDASSLVQRDIQSELPNLILRTYDEVVLRMKWKIEKMRKKSGLRLTP